MSSIVVYFLHFNGISKIANVLNTHGSKLLLQMNSEVISILVTCNGNMRNKTTCSLLAAVLVDLQIYARNYS